MSHGAASGAKRRRIRMSGPDLYGQRNNKFSGATFTGNVSLMDRPARGRFFTAQLAYENDKHDSVRAVNVWAGLAARSFSGQHQGFQSPGELYGN